MHIFHKWEPIGTKNETVKRFPKLDNDLTERRTYGVELCSACGKKRYVDITKPVPTMGNSTRNMRYPLADENGVQRQPPQPRKALVYPTDSTAIRGQRECKANIRGR